LPAEGEKGNTALQNPLNGLCSASTSQWTAGLLGFVPLPCTNSDNRINELPVLGEITYTTAAMDQDYYFNGPIQADLYISSTMPDASVVVRVTDVAPNGRSTELTNGILTASLRQVDETRSRFIKGVMIQPWHPYTAESREAVGIGNVVPLAVEVFPTSAVIKQGHRLRITVGASDFPHGLPPVTDLLDQILGFLTVKSEAVYPSSVVLPMVPLSAIPPPG
jgi:putative CocE/NonD family hydrolase